MEATLSSTDIRAQAAVPQAGYDPAGRFAQKLRRDARRSAVSIWRSLPVRSFRPDRPRWRRQDIHLPNSWRRHGSHLGNSREIFLDRPARIDALRHRLSYPGTSALYPDLSVEENIRYIGDLRRVLPAEITSARLPIPRRCSYMDRFRDRLCWTAQRWRHEAETRASVRLGSRAACVVAGRTHHRRRSRFSQGILWIHSRTWPPAD